MNATNADAYLEWETIHKTKHKMFEIIIKKKINTLPQKVSPFLAALEIF